VTEKQCAFKTHALLAAISIDGRMDHYEIFSRSVKNLDFSGYLKQQRQIHSEGPIVIFMDYMRVHHSRMSKELYEELGIIPVFKIPYSPQFNPIESVFSIIKQSFKKDVLYHLINGKRLMIQTLIRKAVNGVNQEKIMNCI
jgi:transposase